MGFKLEDMVDETASYVVAVYSISFDDVSINDWVRVLASDLKGKISEDCVTVWVRYMKQLERVSRLEDKAMFILLKDIPVYLLSVDRVTVKD
jgi:hypothetical protein